MTDPITAILSYFLSKLVACIMGIIKLLIEVCASPGIWKFVQSKIKKIPRYITLLLYIYNAEKPGSEIHKKVTVALLLLSSILMTMTSNFLVIGFPLVGLITEAIALLVAFAIILGTMEILLRSFGDEYFNRVKDVDIKDDIKEIEKLLGPTWKKLIDQLENTFNTLAPEIEANFKQISDYIESYFKINLRDSCIFINPLQNTEITFTKSNIKKIGQGIESWEKTIVSLAEGSVAASAVGLGASSVAGSIFVQSGLWTSFLSALGVNTGIAVSASTFTLFTVGLPITLASATAAGVMWYGFKRRSLDEKEKESKFFTSTILSMLPMAYADGFFCQKEKDTIHQFVNNARLTDEDHDIIYQAIEKNKYQSFDKVLQDNLLLKNGHSNAEIQHTLLLFSAWELAKIDGLIHPKEFELFERMAYILKIDPKIYRKIQNLVTPEIMSTKSTFTTPIYLSKDYIPLVSIMDDFI